MYLFKASKASTMLTWCHAYSECEMQSREGGKKKGYFYQVFSVMGLSSSEKVICVPGACFHYMSLTAGHMFHTIERESGF